MKRQYNTKQLATLANTAADYRDRIKAVRIGYDLTLKKLNDPAEAKKYTPDYIAQMRRDAKREALDALEVYGREAANIIHPALAERGLHARETYLVEAGFATDEAPSTVDQGRDAKMLRAMIEAASSIKQMVTFARLARYSDEQLAGMAEHATRVGDVGLAGATLEEAKLRGNSMLKMKVEEATRDIKIEAADEAEKHFQVLEDTLRDVSDIAAVIQDPDNKIAHAGLRSREIREETDRKRAEEAAEREASERKAREQRLTEQKERAEKYLAEAPKPAAA
jgi:hypothetical protein